MLSLLILTTALARGREENSPTGRVPVTDKSKTQAIALEKSMEKAVSQPLLAEVPYPSQSFPVVGMGSGVGVQGERRSHQDSSRTQVTQRRVPSQRPVIGGVWMCPPCSRGGDSPAEQKTSCYRRWSDTCAHRPGSLIPVPLYIKCHQYCIGEGKTTVLGDEQG